jgi:manganese/zinc-transporting P-type ATPase C
VAEIPASQGRGRSSSRRASFASSRARTAAAASQPVTQPIVRIAPGRDGVSIWSFALFGDPAGGQAREFLARVFSVKEIAAVEIRRSESFGRVHYAATTNAPEMWLKLRRALEQSSPLGPADDPYADVRPRGIEHLYLDGPPELPIWVNRIGASLSTWRLRYQSDHRVRLTHPILLNRKDVAYSLEEELAVIAGVEEFRTNTLTSSVAIQFNPRALTAERLVRQLEKSWPRLLDGLDQPPSGRKLAAATGLLGLAATGQYFVPAVKPLALLGVAIYGLPHVQDAAGQLAHGQIGLPALYAARLTLTLMSGMPFSFALMAVLMQVWPRLAHQTMARSQRRLFAGHRQRATWARVVRDDTLESEVDIDTLTVGDLIAIRKGETIPVDGVVVEGLAAVDEEALSGAAGAVDKAPGDTVYASTFVRDGRVTVRVAKVGHDTVAGYIGARLPRAKIERLLSSAEAERIANRNARSVLAIAGINLLATRRLRPSQAVVRSDYATAPRLSAQLAALHDLGDGLQQGMFFRDPAALDRLPATDIYVFDDTSALERRQIEVAEIFSASNVSADIVLGYAAAAFSASQNERARALAAQSIKQSVPIPEIFERTRHAGAVRYLDRGDCTLELAAPAYVAAMGVNLPPLIADALAASPHMWNPQRDGRSDSNSYDDPLLRPLWVLRDGAVLGVVTFRRQGEQEAVQVIAALKARNKNARFVYLSAHAQTAAEAIARAVGISTVLGDLDPEGKARALSDLGRRTMWIGDGTIPEAIPCIKASTVSISVAGLSTAPSDAADIVLLQPGLWNLVPLRRVGRDHHARIKADYRVVYAANLLGVAGGLLGVFGSLESGLTFNVGTGYVYTRRWQQLRDLISRVEARRAALLTSPSREQSDQLADVPRVRSIDAEQFVTYRDLDASAPPGTDLHEG